MKLAILNTSIVTADGTYTMQTLTLEQARIEVAAAVQRDGIASYVGHEATAAILTGLLGVEVAISRALFAQVPGQTALAFKLNGRPEPGRELSAAELEEIGFTFKLITMADPESLWRDQTGQLWVGPVPMVQPRRGHMLPCPIEETTLVDAAAIAASAPQWIGDAESDEHFGVAPDPLDDAAYAVGRDIMAHHGVTGGAYSPVTVDGVEAATALVDALRLLAMVDVDLEHTPDASDDYSARNELVVRVVALAVAVGLLAGYRYDAEADRAFRLVAYVELPGQGQVSWHLPTHQVPGWPSPWPAYWTAWDGHSRDDKATRIAGWLAAQAGV